MSAGNPNDDFDDELLSAYVDGELTAAERALVDERLRSDPAAAALVEELRGLSSAIKSLPPQTLGRDLRAGVLAEIDEARADLAKRGPATLTAPPVDRRAGMRRGLIWSAMAIAAAVLVALFQPAEIVQEERELARAEQDKLRESTAVKKVAPEESKSELADVGGDSKPRDSHDQLATARAASDALPPGLRGSLGVSGGEGAESMALAGADGSAPAAPLTAPMSIPQQSGAELLLADGRTRSDASREAMFAELQPAASGVATEESLERSAPTVTLQLATPDGAAQFRQLLAESKILPAEEMTLRRQLAGRGFDESTADAETGQLAAAKEKSDAMAENAMTPEQSLYYFAEVHRFRSEIDGARGGKALSDASSPGDDLVWVVATPAELESLLQKLRMAKEVFATVEWSETPPETSTLAALGTTLKAEGQARPKSQSLEFKPPATGDVAANGRQRVLFVLEPAVKQPELATPAAAEPPVQEAK